MQTVLEHWPIAYIGLWLYPFLGWRYFARRRHIREFTSLVLGRNCMNVQTETCQRMLRQHIRTMGSDMSVTEVFKD